MGAELRNDRTGALDRVGVDEKREGELTRSARDALCALMRGALMELIRGALTRGALELIRGALMRGVPEFIRGALMRGTDRPEYALPPLSDRPPPPERR